MKITLKPFLIVAALSAAIVPINAHAQTFSLEELENRLVERRAVDAAIWGMPIISLDAMRQAYFRDGEAEYGDIVWWPKGNAWQNQSLTPNTTVRYLYSFLNTKESGPIVLDIPPAMNGNTILGTVVDAWQVPIIDVGADGKAAKFIILPPDYSDEVPAGYLAIRPKTYNVFVAMRSILKSRSERDEALGDALVAQIGFYPLASADKPPVQRIVDMTNTLYSGLVNYDESLYTSLARMLNEEPVQPKDQQMMGMLLPLGIEKGKEFKPDAATVTQLRTAAAEARDWLAAKRPTFTSDWWPDSQWKLPTPSIGPKSGFKWTTANYFDVDARGIGLSAFFVPPAKLGAGSFYLSASSDSDGQPFASKNTYRLHVPPNVPVGQFWAATIYSSETSALFLNLTKPTIDSLTQGLQANADGSVDVLIGPKSQTGQESNWIQPPEGKGWFVWFRFYGPETALLDKSWTMPDIEKVN